MCAGLTAPRLAMLTFLFLRLGSAGGEERVTWSKDKPLKQEDGGSAASITNEKMKNSSETLRTGGSVLGLTTLTSFSTEFSYPGIRFHVQRLEALARKKFTMSPNNVVGGGMAAGMTKGASGGGCHVHWLARGELG